MTEEQNNALKDLARNTVALVSSWLILIALIVYLGVAS
jgi:hypothetical protein